MNIGKRIKAIRIHRKLTQDELGKMIGLGGDRVRQYELSIRSPKEEILREIVKALKVDYHSLKKIDYENAVALDLVETLFWLEEFGLLNIDLFSFEKINEKEETWKYDAKFNRYSVDRLIDEVPVGIAIRDNNNLSIFLKEWMLRKQELLSGDITQSEYFEWKINFPASSDNCGKSIPNVQWKKQTSALYH